MLRLSDHSPAWRTLAALLTAFAVGAQLVLSGLLIGARASAADQAELSIICAHDPAAIDRNAPGSPPQPKSHDLCPACAFAQSGKLAAPLPAAPLLAVLSGRSEILPARPAAVGHARRFQSPYASRAPPFVA